MKKLSERFTMTALALNFLLGVKGDYLALWENDDPEPVEIFYSCQVSRLPPADQILLHRGIKAEDQQALTAVLEDYL